MSSRERNMLILLGVLLLAGLAYLFFFVLGGEEPAEEAAPTPTASPPPIPATPGTGVGEPPTQPPRAVTFFGGRDPFVPLIVAEAGAGGIGAAPAEPGAPTDGAAPPGAPPGGAPAPGQPPVEAPGPGAEGREQPGVTVGGRQVVLVDIVDEDTAQIEVDGEPMTVSEGETFDRNFELESVEGTCARFLFGDQSFTLCEGEAPK